jgi:hypothetical protein
MISILSTAYIFSTAVFMVKFWGADDEAQAGPHALSPVTRVKDGFVPVPRARHVCPLNVLPTAHVMPTCQLQLSVPERRRRGTRAS